MTRRLLLIRHCESTGLQPDAPLTARGEAQARALADRLAPLAPDLIVSSPFRRARQTVEPLAATRGLAVEIDERLAERQLAAEPPVDFKPAVRRSFEDFDHCLPGGESSQRAQARGRQALESILGRNARLPIVATHGANRFQQKKSPLASQKLLTLSNGIANTTFSDALARRASVRSASFAVAAPIQI